MNFFELEPTDISILTDSDLRELVGRLCEAEMIRQNIQPSCVLWGGAQEAADGGLDVCVKGSKKLSSHGFVPHKNTSFQVKKNSMGKAACKKEMLEKGSVKPVIVNLACQKGAYIIVSGKDDCSDKMLSERLSGMSEAVEGLACKNDLLLDFYGRDRLTTWLRQYPGVSLWVRSRLGKPLSGWKPFGRWAATPQDQDDTFLLDNHPCVIDRNSQQKEPMEIADAIKLTRKRLRDVGSTVRITGLSGVGKTRFVQALFEAKVGENALPETNVIYADLGDDISPTASELISYLIANGFVAYLILDNCPSDVHRALQKQVSSSGEKLSLLTIEYDISDDQPEETEVIHIEPSSEKTVSRLVQRRFPFLGNVNADKIAEFSGGNARLAIALTSRVGADETLTSFSDEDLFYKLFSQRKGVSDSLLESAEVLSLVYSFNVSHSEFNDELGVLATIGGLGRRALHRNHAELLRRQLAQQRGNWRAILPHALANRLARRALENITPNEINAELFKRENLRLFKSCAHRLGYLHDFEPARQLANTWVQSGGPLHDIASCDEELLVALEYIAPVFPGTVLTAIEAASDDPVFASRNNKHFSVFVRLLCQLAYEDESFDRAAGTILKFAETEKADENNNSVVEQLKDLFSLCLSGTQATPARRQAFLNRLLVSSNPRLLEIASEIFRSTFKTSHWASMSTFDFGARKRDYGWEPKTHGEKLDWFVGFIELLKPVLTSNDEVFKKWAKELLVNHFRRLWSSAGCFDILEEIVRDHGTGGSWPEMWMAIKGTIYFGGEEQIPKLRIRLEELERLSAPIDLYSEIEAYAFTNTWRHREVRGVNGTEKSKSIREKIIKLGELAATEPKYLGRLAPRLWEKNIDALCLFGEGLAKGSVDQSEMFEYLISLVQEQELKLIQPILFRGFISGVHTGNSRLARQLQERVLEVPELKPHFIYLLSATPVAPWGVKKLLELARNGKLDAWQFRHIRSGRIHEGISNSDLAEILLALNELEGGVFSSLDILSMRFFTDKNSGSISSEALRFVGRKTICKLLSLHRYEINRYPLDGIDGVVDECLSGFSPENEIDEIIELLCEDTQPSQLYNFELEVVIFALIENFTELVLNRVFKDEEKKELPVHLLSKVRIPLGESLLNLAPVDRVVKWCNGNENRIQKIAAAVSSYTFTDKENSSLGNPRNVVLSEHIKALLDVAKNKLGIVETILAGIESGPWFGSRAEIIEAGSKAFVELLEHDSREVREFAKIKLVLIEKRVREARERDAEYNNKQEQRFE